MYWLRVWCLVCGVQSTAAGRTGSGAFKPVVMGREQLRELDKAEVFVLRWPTPLRSQFVKHCLYEHVTITRCKACNRVSFYYPLPFSHIAHILST